MTRTVSIIHGDRRNINSRSFVFPLWFYRRDLEDADIQLRFFTDISAESSNSQYVFLDSKVMKSYWSGKSHEGLEKLEQLSRTCDNLFWFNTSDSSGLIQRQVFPFVKKYLKSHILRNKKDYMQGFYGGRPFTDFYFRNGFLDGSNEKVSQGLADHEIEKISVSWNLGMANVFCYRSNLIAKVDGRSRLLLLRRYGRPTSFPLGRTKNRMKRRTNLISARLSTGYSRESVAFQRRYVCKVLKQFGVPMDRVSMREYFSELALSKYSVSPFGWGEINIRDFESILSGACLIKPDMESLETYPNVYLANKTYIPFRWNFSDLVEVIDRLESVEAEEVAHEALDLYLDYIGQRGSCRFVEKIVTLLDE